MSDFQFYFGDATYRFALDLGLIGELEELCSAGIGRIAAKVYADDYSAADLQHIIRLGLIGGETSPERASKLVNTYFIRHGIVRGRILAAGIIETVFADAVERVETPGPTDSDGVPA